MTINAKSTINKSESSLAEPRPGEEVVDPNSEEALLIRVENPTEAPRTELIKYWKEALMMATIITPRDFSRDIKRLCENRRGIL
mgnify:FL=1